MKRKLRAAAKSLSRVPAPCGSRGKRRQKVLGQPLTKHSHNHEDRIAHELRGERPAPCADDGAAAAPGPAGGRRRCGCEHPARARSHREKAVVSAGHEPGEGAGRAGLHHRHPRRALRSNRLQRATASARRRGTHWSISAQEHDTPSFAKWHKVLEGFGSDLLSAYPPECKVIDEFFIKTTAGKPNGQDAVLAGLVPPPRRSRWRLASTPSTRH